MASKIELISRSKEGDGSRSTFCMVGESLSAKSSTLYVIKLDDDAIPTDTLITREGGELHFVFPSRVTFDITDWDKAAGSELAITSGARTFDDVSKRFILGQHLEGGTFSIRSNTRLVLGHLGSSHALNFQALEAVLSRLRLRNTGIQSRCPEHRHQFEPLSRQTEDPMERFPTLELSIQGRAMRCACDFPGLHKSTN
jgi:hypothetical protein